MLQHCNNVNHVRVLIVLLNWNGHQKTTACIRSLQAMEFSHYRVLVIDNGSSDDSIAALSAIENIDLIKHTENLGFTGGCNRGLIEAKKYGAEFVWLLNTDAEVAPDCLSRLLEAAEANPDAALLSPMLYHSANRDHIQHCGSRYRLAPASIDEAPDPETAHRWQHDDPISIVLWGTALLVRTSTLSHIGLLDERLFAYSEDTEYSIRCGKAGFEKLLVEDARVWHDWASDLRLPYYYYYTVRNDLLMWRRHLPITAYPRIVRWNFARTRRLLKKLSAHPEHCDACLSGFWDGLRQRGGAYDNRGTMPALLRSLLLPAHSA
jgi:GT2 family glycosyltransferase